ncbi:MAG: F0F1 ATP synthase subunit A, partial [Myxococcales bacterium]|nr:F0F1 ATP synthase subunit A [Myxococcales bacterium]
MRISPDQWTVCQYEFIKINSTIIFSWLIMFFLTIGSIAITRKLSTSLHRSRWQNLLEIIVLAMKKQIYEVGLSPSLNYLSFIGTLFLFIVTSALLTIFPGYE